MTNHIQNIIKKSEQIFWEKIPDDITLKEKYYETQIRPHFESILTQALQEQAKAYGGCESCYGKGYNTNLDAWSGTDEFTHKEYSENTPYYNYCKYCDRGKQFKEAMEYQDIVTKGKIRKDLNKHWDKLESEDTDKSTEKWREYKYIRNNNNDIINKQ